MKSLAYTNRDTTVFYRSVGSKLSMLTNNWELYSGATILESGRTRVGCLSALSGGSLFDGLNGNVFTASTTKTLSNMSLQFTTFNMNNVTLGAGITLDGGSFTNTQITMSDLTFINQPVFQLANGQTYTFNDDVGDFTLNLASGTATVNITGSTLTPTLTGGGTITIPVASTSTTFEVDGSLPSGRVILKQRGSAAGVFISKTHTTGTATEMLNVTNVSTGEDTWDMYYKATNVLTGSSAGREFYLTTFSSGTNLSSSDRTLGTVVTTHPDILTNSAEQVTAGSESLTFSTVTTQTTATLTGTNAVVQISQPRTQRLFLNEMDDDNYLKLLANNQSTKDFIEPLIQSGTGVNSDFLTITASDQQIYSAIGDTGTGTLIDTFVSGGKTFAAAFVIPNSSGISVPEVVSAVRPLTDSIENRVADIADKDETLPGPFKKAAYNPATDYTT